MGDQDKPMKQDERAQQTEDQNQDLGDKGGKSEYNESENMTETDYDDPMETGQNAESGELLR